MALGTTRTPTRVRRRSSASGRGREWSARRCRAARAHLHDLMLLPIERCARLLRRACALPAPLDEATDLLLAEIRARLRYLCDVGLGYLTLDRQSRTLSGGEVQRINLTTALGTSLVNTLFVLDEPSIGLHPRDMGRVIGVMQRLRDAGNSLVVVEHDPQIMLAADRMLDMGPGPGERGGEIVFFGTPRGAARRPRLAHRRIPVRPQARRRRRRRARRLRRGRRSRASRSCGRRRAQPEGHRRRDSRCGRLVCVTGVSRLGQVHAGAGRAPPGAAQAPRASRPRRPGAHRALHGARARSTTWCSSTSRRSAAPRAPTRRATSARSTPIRDAFAQTPLTRKSAATRAGTFSFNAGNGRCPTCSGNGFEHVEMQFLSDVYLRCPDCDGRRYRAEVLEVQASRRGSSRSPTCSTDRDRGARVLRAATRRCARACSRSPTWASTTWPRPAGADAVAAARRSA